MELNILWNITLQISSLDNYVFSLKITFSGRKWTQICHFTFYENTHWGLHEKEEKQFPSLWII